jgi:hypothetical protein
MSVQSETNRISYVGNNSTVTAYQVPFYFFANADLVVVVTTSAGVDTTLTLNTDYTVTGAGNEAGGSLTTAAAVPASSTVTIYREIDITQDVSLIENGDLPAETLEQALDRLTMIAQQTDRASKRAIRVRESDGPRNELQAIANTILSLNSSKQPVGMTASELKTFLAITGVELTVDAGMRTFADDGERASTVPQFTGQLGTQRDTNLVYISTGTSAGNWGLLTASLAMILAGTFTADATGRGKFANGFVNADLLASDAVTTAKILDLNVTAAKLAATLDLSGKTLTMPASHFMDIAPNGTVIQTVYAEYTGQGTLSGNIPGDNTIPQSSEGDEILTAAITPRSASSVLLIRFVGCAGVNNQGIRAALFRDSTANAISATQSSVGGSNETQSLVIEKRVDAVSVVSTTFKIRTGSAATYRINGSSGAGHLGAASAATLVIQEIKA